VENEAWDGSIERTIKILDTIGHDDMEDEVVQTPIIIQITIPSISVIATQISAQTTLVRSASAQSTPRA